MRRTISESLERRKEMMIAALWANSGFEGQEGADARRSAIENLEEHYDEAVSMILHGGAPQEEQIEEDNPFFQAAERGLQKVLGPANADGTVEDAIASEEQLEHLDIDQ